VAGTRRSWASRSTLRRTSPSISPSRTRVLLAFLAPMSLLSRQVPTAPACVPRDGSAPMHQRCVQRSALSPPTAPLARACRSRVPPVPSRLLQACLRSISAQTALVAAHAQSRVASLRLAPQEATAERELFSANHALQASTKGVPTKQGVTRARQATFAPTARLRRCLALPQRGPAAPVCARRASASVWRLASGRPSDLPAPCRAQTLASPVAATPTHCRYRCQRGTSPRP